MTDQEFTRHALDVLMRELGPDGHNGWLHILRCNVLSTVREMAGEAHGARVALRLP